MEVVSCIPWQETPLTQAGTPFEDTMVAVEVLLHFGGLQIGTTKEVPI